MKKRTLVVSLAAMAITAIASAMVVVYQGALVSEAGLAYGQNYTLDAFNTHVDYASAQAVYSQGAPSAVTFIDGTVSTATITISSNPAAGIANTILAFGTSGTTLISSRDWFWQSTSSGTAKSISDAIQANATLSAIILSTWTTGGVVTATSTSVGSTVNYALTSSTAAAVAVVGFTGGTANNVLTASNRINKANTFTTGLGLLYTKTAGTNPANLNANTTYYAIPVDANNFKLATSSTNAAAGTAITIATSATLGGGTFVLTPLAYAGTAAFKWQASNDGVNFSDLAVSSVTYSSPSTTPSSTLWDFSTYDYRYLRLAVVGPTAGGLRLTVTIIGKNTNNQ